MEHKISQVLLGKGGIRRNKQEVRDPNPDGEWKWLKQKKDSFVMEITSIKVSGAFECTEISEFPPVQTLIRNMSKLKLSLDNSDLFVSKEQGLY